MRAIRGIHIGNLVSTLEPVRRDHDRCHSVELLRFTEDRQFWGNWYPTRRSDLGSFDACALF